MRTVVSSDGYFEWDCFKSKCNKKKHGFAFDEILEVFDDPCFLSAYDEEHSKFEHRFYGIGCLSGLVLLVFYTERHERIRLISARLANKTIQEVYYDRVKNTD